MVQKLILVAILAAFLGIPILTVYSLRDWAANRSTTLPDWRSKIGVWSVGAILLGWLLLVVLTILRFVSEDWRYLLTEKKDFTLILLAIAATLSCFTLKGTARRSAVVAGALLVLLAILASLWLPGDL
jgi:hypothetical protein